MAETLEALYTEMLGCTSCKMRAGCTRVVPGTGQMVKPILMIVGEAPGQQEDEAGEPFVGAAGEILRAALRKTTILKKSNTLISNVLKCRPPGNKFPKDECPEICVSKWLWEEIRLAEPKRLLLLGNTPLKYVAGLEGITACRGNWYNIRGVRTMATFHPSYIMRQNSAGIITYNDAFEKDIQDVADEVKKILDAQEAEELRKCIEKESASEAENRAGTPADPV